MGIGRPVLRTGRLGFFFYYSIYAASGRERYIAAVVCVVSDGVFRVSTRVTFV